MSLNIELPDSTMNSIDNINFSSSSILTKEECILKICEILELDDSDQSKRIAEKSITDGRKALHDYDQDLSPRILRDEIDESQSEVLKLLIRYIEQEWYRNTPEWFQQYLQQKKTVSSNIYNQILIRTADYGSKFIKENLLLSLIIQFLFEFDDKRILETPTIDQIRENLIADGRQGIEQYADDIALNVKEEQLKNDESPLYLALQDYYCKSLKNLFEDPDVAIQRANTIKIALTCVTNDGWWKGLHNKKFQDEIAQKKFKKLIEKLIDYLNKNKIPIPVDALSNGNSTNSSLINSASSSSVSSQPSAITTSTFSSNQSSNSSYIQIKSSILNETKPISVITTNIDEEKRNDECKIIIKCINEDDKLKLSHLVEAGELIYIDKKLNDVIDKIINDYACQKYFSLFINNCLIPMMYLLKRHQNLDDFIECLFQKYDELELSLKST
ncbi:unnamed protein product [Rotaria sordida]|uniref:Uncharacterized protein n=1 Tax=Rotaria sordida TaxID=392033 RepID=A0A815D4L1_9BILA|nr:unnamed protein product [Rotaria sordida]CAF4113738.1 unnamed protein product [Rotaria sordida]